MPDISAPAIHRLEWDELAPELQARLTPRLERLGYIGEFFRVAAHQPAALVGFIDFTESLKSALPGELTQTIALTISTELGNDYERHQHERLCLTLGLSAEWVLAAEGRGDQSLLDGASTVCRRLALAALTHDFKACGRAVDALIACLPEEQVVGVLLTVGRYVAHTVVVRTLDLQPSVPSIFPVGAA